MYCINTIKFQEPIQPHDKHFCEKWWTDDTAGALVCLYISTSPRKVGASLVPPRYGTKNDSSFQELNKTSPCLENLCMNLEGQKVQVGKQLFLENEVFPC